MNIPRAFLKQIGIGTSCFFLGDVLAQKITERQDYDLSRGLRFAIFGSWFGAVGYKWYILLDKWFKPDQIVRKVAADLLLFGPVFNAVFLLSDKLLQNPTDLSGALAHCRKTFLPIYGAELLVWPGIQYVNFRYVPTQVPYLEKAGPLLQKVAIFLNTVEPYVSLVIARLQHLWELAEQYNAKRYFPIIYGLILVFFGGYYILLLAAIEAYRLMGWEKTYKHIKIIYDDYCYLVQENKKDDEEDLDKNGIPDVEEITKKELFTRKLLLFLRTVNPDKLSPALFGLYMGFISVIATLRIQFAQTLALGCTLGDVFAKFANNMFGPVLFEITPSAYRKWLPHIISYGCKTLGVSVAWIVQRVISSFYSAIRGAQFVVHGGLEVLLQRGFIKERIEEDSISFNGLVAALAAFGFLVQLASGFELPFLLKILLFPFSLAENFLFYFVAIDQHYVPPQ